MIKKLKASAVGETPEARPSTRAPRAARPRPVTAAPEAAPEIILAPVLSSVIGYLLRRAHGTFQAYWMEEFRGSATPITPVQGGMLVVLGSNPGLTQTGLARMMNVEGPTLMQAVDRLEQQDYVRRVRRPGDRRSYALELTPRGEVALTAIRAFLPVRDDDLLKGLTTQEIVQLAKILTRIIERGHEVQKELRAAEGAAEGAAVEADPDAEVDGAATKSRRRSKGK